MVLKLFLISTIIFFVFAQCRKSLIQMMHRGSIRWNVTLNPPSWNKYTNPSETEFLIDKCLSAESNESNDLAGVLSPAYYRAFWHIEVF